MPLSLASGRRLGFDRTLEAAEQFRLIPNLTTSSVLITVFNKDLHPHSLDTAKKLRNKKINCDIYPNPEVKLDKQLKFANKKGFSYIIIIGPDEAENKTVTLKNMLTKEQKQLSFSDTVNLLLSSNR